MDYEKLLAEVLTVAQESSASYSAPSMDLGYGRLFGGQLLAQAYLSAVETVDETRVCHSLHSYFLNMGHASQPVFYDVEIVRDGRSFSNRRVKAHQNGKTLFVMSASFQRAEEEPVLGKSWRVEPKKPEDIEDNKKWLQEHREHLSERVYRVWTQPSVFEQRSEERLPFLEDQKSPAEWNTWFRLQQTSLKVDSVAMQHALFLWYSDTMILIPALKVHGVTFGRAPYRMASLDHSVWFHRALDLKEWQLNELSSSHQGGGRTLCDGKVFSRNGDLLVTVFQESLMRSTD